MTIWDVLNNQSSLNVSEQIPMAKCAELCSSVAEKMFLPFVWNSLLIFGVVVVLAVTYVMIPRDFRKDVIESSPHFFLKNIKWLIFLLFVPAGWLLQGVLMYVVFG